MGRTIPEVGTSTGGGGGRRCAPTWFLGAALAVVLVALPAVGAARVVEAESRGAFLEDGRLEVTVEGLVAAPFAAVRAVLTDVEGLGGWFPAIAEWRVVGSTADEVEIYGCQDMPWPMADRDYVVTYRRVDRPPAFVLEAAARPGRPREAGRVRIERMITEWKVVPAGQNTRVRYRFVGDPATPLPDWVERSAWQRSTNRLLEALAGELERRRAALATGPQVSR